MREQRRPSIEIDGEGRWARDSRLSEGVSARETETAAAAGLGEVKVN